MDPTVAAPSRASRLEDAALAAIERVAALDPSATSEDLFAPLGEALYWLTALMDETHSGPPEEREPLLSGLRWARNQVTHGAIVSAPVTIHGRFTVGRSRLRGGDVLGGSGHSWVIAEAIPTRPDGSRDAMLPAYRAHVSGRWVVRTLREGLVLARSATE